MRAAERQRSCEAWQPGVHLRRRHPIGLFCIGLRLPVAMATRGAEGMPRFDWSSSALLASHWSCQPAPRCVRQCQTDAPHCGAPPSRLLSARAVWSSPQLSRLPRRDAYAGPDCRAHLSAPPRCLSAVIALQPSTSFYHATLRTRILVCLLGGAVSAGGRVTCSLRCAGRHVQRPVLAS